MIRKVTGIVISTVDYKESSKIVNIFTEAERQKYNLEELLEKIPNND